MNSETNEEFFHNLERELFDAWEEPGDAEAIERLYSDSFLSINADGSHSTKEEAVEVIDADQFPVCESIENNETKVRDL